ncbi:phosphoenolpyruvate synthase [Rhodovibrio salinarum]|uniref:Phosphoenolpyruvate synthase n=1 Tax=Rhodovibrio salinarum TaxID=1087 RepID=A0A934QGJ5_9PROT|nr:phosphoenolpyruvate synthase [Rhodovibrio salinarum]MBK1696155.1 phosphoenolpyruvate synthase [Rhodovibrio salinarum]
MADPAFIREFSELRAGDVSQVGGKNASLGEMMANTRSAGIAVPDGFATTAAAYWAFLDATGLRAEIEEAMAELQDDLGNLPEIGRRVRSMIEETDLPAAMYDGIAAHYGAMCREAGLTAVEVAVRSSATAEDLPDASFAGQQESFLNVHGLDAVVHATKKCLASLYNDRAIAYRIERGFDHDKVALSVGIQRMVRADCGAAGVMFSIETETGFPNGVLVTGAWGLGETVVQGMVDPDEWLLFKPHLEDTGKRPVLSQTLGSKQEKMVYAGGSTEVVATSEDERRSLVLSTDEVLQLGRWAKRLEEHYGRPMDIEWAKDGVTGELFVVQARPETVQSQRNDGKLKSYCINSAGATLTRGYAIGDAVAAAPVCRLDSPDEADRFVDGSVLVTGMTDPDWVPVMRRAAAVVTEQGGRTSHAAIVSRELELPAITGTGNARAMLADGQEVTVSCAEGGEGFVYDGIADYTVEDIDLDQVPQTDTAVMLNVGNPLSALRWWRLPSDGVGLARLEFIVSNLIKCHPMALIDYDRIEDAEVRAQIDAVTRGYDDKAQYFVDTLARAVAHIAAVAYPKPVIVRMSDFKTNEYADLIGGKLYEPDEENPMLGWRGASRYYHDQYQPGFELECEALRVARDVIGMSNIKAMVPFCRTPDEADRVIATMANAGLRRGENGLEIYAMCEVPANVVLAEAFAERFDGFSIGSNDLTQLILGIDRDSSRLSNLFDERDDAVLSTIADVVQRAQAKGCKVGLCGQGPSDRVEFARDLVSTGIDSMSVTPDSFVKVKNRVAALEQNWESDAVADAAAKRKRKTNGAAGHPEFHGITAAVGSPKT